MDLSQVNTASDLINANEAVQNPLEAAIEAAKNLNYNQTLDAIEYLAQELMNIHYEIGNSRDASRAWDYEAGKLAVIRATAKSIDRINPDNN